MDANENAIVLPYGRHIACVDSKILYKMTLKKPRRLSTTDQKELRSKHPKLAEAFEQLMAENRYIKNKFHDKYMGKYIDKRSGTTRRLTIGSILECLEAFDYEIEISAVKKAEREMKAASLQPSP
jgi:hypothetical protein